MTQIQTKMKETGIQWVGNIPNDWGVVRIKYLFGESKEKVLAKDYNILSLTLNGIKIRDISNNDGQLPATFDNYKIIRKGYIVFNPMDLKRGYVDSSIYEGIISPAYIVLDCKERVNTNFYKYYFQWHYNDVIFWHMGRGVSEDHRWTLEEKVLFNYKVVLPELNTQKHIANFLDQKIDKIKTFIKNKKKLIELLEEQKISIINKAVTKGLDENIKMKDSGISWIGEIPEDWEVRKLKTLSKVQTGSTPKDPDKNPAFINGNIPWYGPGDFKKSLILANETSKMINEEAMLNGELNFYPKDTVFIIGIGATLGKVGLAEGKSTSNQQLNAITFSKEVIPRYGLLFLNSIQDIIKNLANSSTLPILNQTQTKDLFLFLPSLNIQKQIIEYLETQTSKINQTIQTIENEIKFIEEYRDSLIYHAVTGKLNIQ